MQKIELYDYEKAKSDYLYSLQVITPPNNDGSRPRYAFPIKHQVLRCGKWIPTEEIFYNSLYYLHSMYHAERVKACEAAGYLVIDGMPTNIRKRHN